MINNSENRIAYKGDGTAEEFAIPCERTPAYRGGSFLLQREQHH